MKSAISVVGILAVSILAGPTFSAQQAKKEASFKWVNAFPKGKYHGLQHGTFTSPSNSDSRSDINPISTTS